MNSIHQVFAWLTMPYLGSLVAHAQMTVVPDTEPQRVFAGDGRKVAVAFHNASGSTLEGAITVRLHQTTSAMVVRLSDAPWKRLQIFPGQTVVESARLSFPEAKAETRFLIQWVEGTNKVAGKTEVLVYPPDLLKELKPLAGDRPLGAFDPQNQLKPLLKNLPLAFEDLEDKDFETFSGKLAIVGPFESKARIREGLGKQIEALAAKGVAVVWIQPPPERRDKLQPTFYTVAVGKGAVVVVQAGMVSDLSDSPQSQLNLIHFSRLALRPEPVRLPHLAPQP